MDFSWLAAITGGAQGASHGLDDVLAQRNLEDTRAREDARFQQTQATAAEAARVRNTLAALELMKGGQARVRGDGVPGTPTAAPIAAAGRTPVGSAPNPASGAAPSRVQAALQGAGFLPQLEDLELVPQSEQDARAVQLKSAEAAAVAKARAPYEPWHPKTMADAITLATAPAAYRASHPTARSATDPRMSGLVHQASIQKAQLQDARTAIAAGQRDIAANPLGARSTPADSAAHRAALAGLARFQLRADSLRGALDRTGAAMTAGAPDESLDDEQTSDVAGGAASTGGSLTPAQLAAHQQIDANARDAIARGADAAQVMRRAQQLHAQVR